MKKFNKKFGLLGWLLLFSVIAMGSKIGGDITRFGTLTGTDIELQLGEGRIVWDSATSKMQFSNDSGGITKDIGSGGGGGGGQNFFSDKSFDAESGLTGWTNGGGGTFVLNGSTPINGENDFTWNASAQNDFLRTDLIAIPEKFKGQACEANFTYSGGTNNLVKPQVTDSSDIKLPGATFQNQVDGSEFLQAQTGIVQRTIFFICPSAGDIKFQFLQTAAGDPALMNFDDVHVGELIGLQTTVIEEDWASCGFVDADFGGTGFGTVTEINLNCRKHGPDLLISGSFRIGTVAAASDHINIGNIGFTVDTSAIPSGTRFRAGYVNRLQVGNSMFDANNGGFFADSTQTDRIIFTSGGITQTTFSPTNVSGVFATNDTLVVQLRIPVVENAAQPVKIFLSIPKVAEVLNSFSARVDADVASSTVFSTSSDWLDSPPITRLALGRYEINFKPGLFTVVPECHGTGEPLNATVRDVTIEAISTSLVQVRITDQGTTLAETDFTIECNKQGVDVVTPVVQPILVNQVETSLPAGTRVESCQVDLVGGTPTADTDSGLCAGWLVSFDDTATGRVNLNVIVGIFSAAPVCTCTSEASGVFNCGIDVGPTTATDIPIIVENNGGTDVDQNFHITCIGAR